ncbi:MAG: Bug family tripartite tricarboxylate transporter substrate binding protein [Burkholderiales bacterium]
MKSYRKVLAGALAAMGMVMLDSTQAQSFPTKPLRVISNSASGSPGDIALRLVAPRISASVGQPVVVETKAGAGGQIAAQDVLRAGADGYSMMFSTNMIISSKYLLKNVTIDVQRDFAPVSMAARVTNLVAVHNSVPGNTLREFVDYAKKNPGKVSVSSNGIGSSLHLQWIGFMQSTGTDLNHIPYGSGNEGLRNNDFLTGRIGATLIPYSSIRQAVEAKQVRILAVLGDSRYKRLPDVPSLNEAIPDYKFTLGFWGFFAPAATPAPIVTRLSDEIQKGFRDADIATKLEALDTEPSTSSPRDFAAAIKVFDTNVAALVKAAGLTPQ